MVSVLPTALVLVFTSAGSAQDRFSALTSVLPTHIPSSWMAGEAPCTTAEEVGERPSTADHTSGCRAVPESKLLPPPRKSITNRVNDAGEHVPAVSGAVDSTPVRSALRSAPHRVPLLSIVYGMQMLLRALLAFDILQAEVLDEVSVRISADLIRLAAKSAGLVTPVHAFSRAVPSPTQAAGDQNLSPRARKQTGTVSSNPNYRKLLSCPLQVALQHTSVNMQEAPAAAAAARGRLKLPKHRNRPLIQTSQV